MKSRRTLLRLLTVFVACMLSLGFTLGLGGCAKTEEDQIRSMVDSSFKVLKKPTEDNLSPFIEDLELDYSSLESYDTNIYEFLSHSNAKLDYEVNSIVIDGRKAVAHLSLTNVDLEAASQQATKEIADNLDDYMDLMSSENAETELIKVFVKKYYEIVDATTETKTTECELAFEKDDDEWVLDDESYQELLEMPLHDVKI